MRLRSLEVGERELNGAKLPVIPLADPASSAALEARISQIAEGIPPYVRRVRCRATLALEGFVAVRCTFFDRDQEDNGGCGDAALTRTFRVGPGGALEEVDDLALFHPYADGRDPRLSRIELVGRFRHRHEPGNVPLVTVTETGLELSWPDRCGELETERIPWRALAPFVRADGPLGPPLVAAGLALAPPGTTMPPLPPEGFAATATGGVSEAMERWAILSDEHRAQARLVTPGGPIPAALVFPPGFPPSALAPLGLRPGSLYYAEPWAEIVRARATGPLEVRYERGPRGAIARVLPAGAIVTALRGVVDDDESVVGAAGWAFVADGPTRGWANGRALAAIAEGECVPGAPPLLGEGPTGVLMARGVVELRDGGASRPHAWFAYAPRGEGSLVLAMFPLEGCTLGPMLRPVSGAASLAQLHFTSTSEGGDSLVVATFANGDLVVLRPEDEAPLFARNVPSATIEAPAARGPGGARGFFPVAVRAGSERFWLAWNGTALEERR